VLLPSTITVGVSRSAEGFQYAGWSKVPHLTGTVTPLT